MDNIIESSGKPLSYEELIIGQLNRIAIEVGDPIKTILNVLILEMFTTVDRDGDRKYLVDISDLDKTMRGRRKGAFDLLTKKENSNMVVELEYKRAIALIEPVMKCLKRAGRFPAKFGLLDEAGADEEIKERDKSGDLPVDS